jgi:hypothetical protein
MITVVCVYWGDKFPIAYLENLRSMIKRNTTVEHKFVVLTDRHRKGFDCRILKPGFTGWWNKLQLFDTFHKLGDRCFYFDLDTVITSDLDWLFKYDGDFLGIEDVGSVNSHQPHLKNVLQSAVMSWTPMVGASIWNEFILRKDWAVKSFRGDGEYLHASVPKYQRELLQKKYPGKLKSYKYQIYNKGLDKDTSIVCFHGRPSIIQAMDETVVTPMQTFEPQNWIKDYWR